jgi:hypothetical protein
MADTFSFDINCEDASISPNGNRSVTITLGEVQKSDVMDLFDIPEFLNHFGQDDVIAQIDEDKLEKWAESNGYTKE